MRWTSLLVFLAFAGCSGASGMGSATAVDAIYEDDRAQAAYFAWIEAGEPDLGSKQLAKHSLLGKASWYGDPYHGRQTASGERFDMFTMTAAHKTLPFGAIVRVMRPDTRQFVVVRVNDRGPFVKGRVIDLSYGAAHDLDMIRAGVVEVELEVIKL